jgi:hypothetical protein
MAKKAQGGPNKSQAIRDYKEANPTASPKEIAEALAKSGVTVSAQFVSTVLSNAKRKGGKIGKRGRKPGRKAGVAGMADAGLEQLLTAKKLVDSLGGIDRARSAIDALAKLLGD